MERKVRATPIIVITLFLFSGSLSGISFTFAENLQPIEYDFGMRITDVAYLAFTGKSNQRMGSILSPVPGDLNGDGHNDLLIGDTRDSTYGSNTGKAFIVWGGPHLKERETNLTTSDVDFIGESQGTDTGTSVSFLGDTNGDGIDDIGITAPKFNGDDYRGRVYVFFGRPGNWNASISVSDADLVMENDGYENIGPISKAGDINGDGIHDFVVSISDKSTDDFTNNGKIYIVFGKASGWNKCMSIDELSDASFEGENTYQYLGSNWVGGNDLNGDGFDDIVVGANYLSYRGRVYIIFGKESGWEKNSSISTMELKIDGHKSYNFGHSMDTGDVNGDGISDLIVGTKHFSGATEDDDFAYLFLGSRSDWHTIETSENATVTFKANSTFPYMESNVYIQSDLNLNGFADIFIAHPREVNSAGSVYLFFGKGTGWKSVMNCSEADASFFGEGQQNNLGSVMANAYGLLRPGLQGILLGAPGNSEGGTYSGKVYYLRGIPNEEPKTIESLTVYSDADFSRKARYLDHGEKAYIELIGEDINSTSRNLASVNVSYGSDIAPIRVICIETGISTGIFRGIHPIKITASYGDKLNFSAVGDPTVYYNLLVDTAVRISEAPPEVFIDQNEELEMKFSNLGWETNPLWTFHTDSTWLSFNPVSTTVSGIPDNGDVGNHVFSISISDRRGNSSWKEIEVEVKNIPPVILNEDKTSVLQDYPYRVNYTSSEDGQPRITWKFSTNATWLFMDTETGVMEGTPNNEYVGQYYMNVRVEDGNGGQDYRSFVITVVNVNDRPVIITEDILSVKQNELYRNQYEVQDPDPNDHHTWSLKTEANWLHMNNVTGLLEGRPAPYDVGIHWVNVTVTDSGELSESRNFPLTVVNVNDPPAFVEFPRNTSVKHGELYRSVVSMYDPDEGDTADFSVSTIPETDLLIDSLTGEIRWRATINCFEKKPNILFVKVIVRDAAGETVSGTFQLEVLPSAKPSVKLISPETNHIVSAKNLTLVWLGMDEEDDELRYDIYISRIQAHIMSLKDDALILTGINGSSTTLSGLQTGMEYYWTVIPYDGCSYGHCEDGARRFYLNSPPEVISLDFKEIRIGEELWIVIKATDKDLPQGQYLSFQLVEGPAGMNVTLKGGILTWEPDKEQTMMHLVTVSVTDGTDTTEMTFTINVLPGSIEKGWSGLPLILGVVITVLVLCSGIGAVLFFRKKKKEHDKEEPEEQVIGNFEDEEKVPGTKCDVSLSVQEAHAQLGRGSKKVSYEELYGTPAPKKDEEEMDSMQLKEFIGQQIKELEKIK